jgi:hypothetical protein
VEGGVLGADLFDEESVCVHTRSSGMLIVGLVNAILCILMGIGVIRWVGREVLWWGAEREVAGAGVHLEIEDQRSLL